MQLIDLHIVDEHDKIIESSDVNFADIIGGALWKVGDVDEMKRKYPWLSTIDPYGNTFFNVHQVPIVIRELETLVQEISDSQIQKIITKAIDFFKKEEQHTYIKLIGD